MNKKSFCVILMTFFCLSNYSYAEALHDSDLDNENPWPRIGIIDEGTTWDIEVTPAGSDETLIVSQTIDGIEIINGKEYYKLWSSVNDGEPELVNYLYIDGVKRNIYALEPNHIDKGERLIYSYSLKNPTSISSINWKGEISDETYNAVYNKNHGPFKVENPNLHNVKWEEYNIFSTSDIEMDKCLGTVRWIHGFGNVTGLLNQCYCINNSDKVVLKRIHSVGDGLIYDANLAGVEQIESSEEKRVSAIYDIRGVQIPDFEPGLNIVRYSDGTVVKVMK